MIGQISKSKFVVIIFLLLCTVCLLVCYHMTIAYERLNGVPYVGKSGKLQTILVEKNESINVWCLENCMTCVDAWYDLIAHAEREVLISMYHWVVYREGKPKYKVENESVVTPHLIILGLALRRLQYSRPNVQVRILFDLDGYKPEFHSEKQISHTLLLWRDLGVHIEHCNLEFMVWRERIGDNMHSKMIIIDRELVWIGSGNVQFSVHEGHPSWGDNGMILYSSQIAIRAAKYFENLTYGRMRGGGGSDYNNTYSGRVFSYQPPWNNLLSTEYKYRKFFLNGCELDASYKLSTLNSFTPINTTIPELEYAIQMRIRKHKSISMRTCPLNNISWMHSYPCNGMWNTKWNSRFNALILAFRNAKHSIAVFSPNMNQPTIWRELVNATRRGVCVRIVTGYAFNNKHSLLYKWGGGFRSNLEMYQENVQPLLEKEPNLPLEWRWYGYNGKLMIDQSPKSAHEKMFFIDSNIIGIGSFNSTVFSIHNCSEILVLLKSQSIYELYYNRFYKPHWHAAHIPN